VLVGRCLNELGGDTHSLTRTDHRTFNDGGDVQFACNFGQALSRAFVPHNGSSRDDAQRADFGEVSNQLVGHAICKEFLGRVAGQILEGQNGNGIQARSSAGRSTTSARQPEGNAYDEGGEDRGEQEGMRFGNPQVARQAGGRRGVRSTRGGRKVSGIHRRNKPVSEARQRFNAARPLGGVTEHLAKPRNRIVQAMVEIDKSVGGPNLRSQLLASDHIAGALEKNGQNLQRLTLQPQSDPVFAQLPCANVQLEIVETQ
jgi:hypothetical protein